MNDFQSEIIGFGLIAIIVLLIALYTKKMENKHK